MKEIQLTQGKFAIVYDADYDALSAHKWCVHGGYAKRKSGGKLIRMHRVIMQPPNGFEIDHINGNKLDNRRSNLRIATHSENQWNKGLRKDNKTGLKGVSRRNSRNGWRAEIQFNGKKIHLGYFDVFEKAAAARAEASKRFHGDFAYKGDH